MNQILKNLVVGAFVIAPFALTGCAPECVDASDCSTKGSNFTCVSGNCTPGSPFPDAGNTGGGSGGGATGGGGGGTTGGGAGGGATGGGGGGGVTGGGAGGGGAELDAGTDAGTQDGGLDLDGGLDAGADAGPLLGIARARANAQQSLTTPVDVSGATVTYLKPVFGTEDAGFFVQASASGPAIFMAIEPSSLTPAPQVGDRVAFTATSYALVTGVSEITSVSNWQRLSSGGSVSGFTQNLSTNPAVAASIDTLEAELISIRGVLDAGFGSAGDPPYLGAFMATALSPADALRFRTPQTVVAGLELERGCDITVGPVPMWRFNAQAQPSAWLSSEVVVHSCPGSTVVNAVPLSATSVRVDFSRTLNATTVLNTGAQFTFDNGATASAAAASGRAVTLTTSPLDGGTVYRVTVANTIADTRGSALAMPNSDTFTALRPLDCTARVVISQVYGGGGDTGAQYTHDFIELHNRSNAPVDVSGWSIQQAAVTGTSWTRVQFPASSIIPAGGFFLIQGESTAAVGAPLPTPNVTVTPTFNLDAVGGKVILTDATVTAPFTTNACPTATGIVDRFGFGSTAGCVEGSFGPGQNTTTAAFRMAYVGISGGAGVACFDSNSNDVDFVTNPPLPRNSTAISSCATICPGL